MARIARSRLLTGRTVHRLKKEARLLHRDFRRLALDDFVTFAADGERRVKDDGVPGHHAIEEMPDGRQVLLAGGDAETLLAQPVEVLADVLGGDAGEFEAPLLAPGEKAVDCSPVGGAGVFVADAAVVKLLGGEDGGLARSLHDIRKGWYLGFGSQDESLGRVDGVAKGGSPFMNNNVLYHAQP